MLLIIFALILGLIPAFIALGKGRNFGLWWLFGAALFIVALPLSLMLPPNPEWLERQRQEVRKCPFCAETVRGEAVVCRYCGRDLPPVPAPVAAVAVPETSGREMPQWVPIVALAFAVVAVALALLRHR